MELQFVLPLRFVDYAIIDANNVVIAPYMAYKSDLYHMKKQKANGEYIVSVINNYHGYFLDDKSEWKKLEDIAMKPEIAPATIEGSVVANYFENGDKRVRNPWGKKGRPE